MMDGAGPVRIAQILLLIIRDRGKGQFPKGRIERREVGQVQSAVQSCQSPICDVPHQRSVKHIDMEVQNIELVDSPANIV